MSDGIPVGLFDPVSWRKSRWTMARAVMMNGRIKWKAKNRVRVALSTENPLRFIRLGLCQYMGLLKED